MNRQLVKDGKKPVFMSKAERKAKELVTHIMNLLNLCGGKKHLINYEHNGTGIICPCNFVSNTTFFKDCSHYTENLRWMVATAS